MKIAPIIPVEVTQFIENHNQELIDILTQVIAENKQLRELLNQTGSTPLALPAASTDAIAKNAPTVNAEAVRIAELENKVTLLEKKLEGFKVGSDLYNLKQLENWKDLNISFNYIHDLCKREIKIPLDLDPSARPYNGKVLDEAFKHVLMDKEKNKTKNPTGAVKFKFASWVIDENRDIKGWISEPGCIFPGTIKKTNIFDPKNPQEHTSEMPVKPSGSRKVSLGTGTGKSTFVPRCVAAHNGGISVVLPTQALAIEVYNNHIDFFANSDKEKAKVCPICEEDHTGYPVALNGPTIKTEKHSKEWGINFFNWVDFLKTFYNSETKSWIKKWALFDEADVKEAGYAFELNNFRAFDKAKREFGMIEASATFPDLPSSKKLDGTVTDYWVTSFEGFETTVDKEFGKKKNLLVFYKDFEKEVTPALAVLKKRGIKFIILNKDMKDYAKQIYASQTGPFLCFLDINIYAAGFDFGDHDAFIIGQHGNNVYLQARGRIGRRTGYVGNVLTTVEGMESAARPIKENEDSDAVKAVFEAMKASAKADKKAEAQDKLNKLVARYNKTEVPQMDPKEGKTNFYRILVKSLEQSFSNYKNLFAILPSEKGKRLPGEFIIKSGLLQFADEKEELTNNILPIIIEIAYCKRICEIAKSYEGDDGWASTENELDDFVFNNADEAKECGFLLNAKKNFTITEFNKTKGILKIKFAEFIFNKKALIDKDQ